MPNFTLNELKTKIKYLLNKAEESEEVRALALDITYGKSDPISAVYDWVKASVRYVPDPINIELLTSPIRLVREYREGKTLSEDCDGVAILTTALYRAVGIPAKVLLLDPETDNGHAVSLVYSAKLKREIMVDPSTNKVPLGWELPYKEKTEI